MSRNRGAVAELTRSAEHEAEWVDFPPTSERPNWARKLLKQGRTAPVAPIPGDKQGPSEENDAAARPALLPTLDAIGTIPGRGGLSSPSDFLGGQAAAAYPPAPAGSTAAGTPGNPR